MSLLTAGDRAAIDRNLMGAKADLHQVVDLIRGHLSVADEAAVALEVVGYVASIHDGSARGLLSAALMELAALPDSDGRSAAGSAPPG